jgi:hypothetical protein
MTETESAAADAGVESRAREAARRPPSDPAPLADLLGSVASARAAWERKRLAVIESDCPGCRFDAPRAMACAFRGHDFCAHVGAIAEAGARRAREANLRRSNAPAEYWRAIIAGRYDDSAAVAAARRIAAREGKLAIFAGGVGGGKSFGMSLALAERGGFFTGAGSLDPFGPDANELLEHCAVVPLLALDDAGAGRSISDVARQRTEQLICQRWDAGLATIVSTNLTRAAFWPLYGGALGRVADRLNADPVGWVSCLEISRRNPSPFSERGER